MAPRQARLMPLRHGIAARSYPKPERTGDSIRWCDGWRDPDADQTCQIVPSLPLASGRITLPVALQLGSAAAAAAAATAAGRWGAIQLWEHPPLQYEPGGARLVLFEGLD